METTGVLLDVDYIIEDGEPVLRIFLESENPTMARFRDFKPYFYVLPDPDRIEEARERLEDLSFEKNGSKVEVVDTELLEMQDSRERVKAIKTHVGVPPSVPKVKDRVKDWEEVREVREFDIPFYKRFIMDKELKPGSELEIEGEEVESGEFDGRVLEADSVKTKGSDRLFEGDMLAFDLEVYDDRVIMCSFYSEDFSKVLVDHEDGLSEDYAEAVDSEKQLIRRMIEVVEEQDPDVILGYNTDEFDFNVLRDRCEEHGIELRLGRLGDRMKFQRRGRFSAAKLKGRTHLDLYAFVETVTATTLDSETLSLDAVAEELLGENKEDMRWEDIKRAWREKRELDKLASYALRDSELAYKLGDMLVPQIMSLSRLTGLVPFDACRTAYGQLVENFLLRKAHQRNIIAPNRPIQPQIAERRRQSAYSGGFVYEPEKGLHENIALFDFRSLYPTIIVSHNLSPDTLNLEDCSNDFMVEMDDGTTYSFCQDQPGFIPDILENLVSERYDIKAKFSDMDEDSEEYRRLYQRQYGLKILANSFYGYLGYASARWYSRECAEATTYLGRDYIHRTIEKAEEMGFEVLYGDTDSVMIKGDNIEEKRDKFLSEVNSMLPKFMELELEGLFKRGLFTYKKSGQGAKKKYALLGKDGSVKITGFAKVRRDWSRVAKQTQEKVIRQVLENDVNGAVDTVKDVIERLNEGEVPVEDLKIYTRMKKKPENYESTAPHVEAAKDAIKRGVEISPGDTIDYVVTSGAGSISDRARLARFAEGYDPEYYIDNQVLPAAIRVLKVFGYTEDQLKGKGKQSGLERFS
ncbi:MAG: DNA-directed DNA polymerase [Candidatus Nanohaloarchaea archaeon]|nr:DNA-directed DNA polymerase [Candidatus Nanohaloarchaea archaeon]